MAYDPDTGIGGASAHFPTTQHSWLKAAVAEGPAAHDAVEAILTVYWKPSYKHVRIRWRKSNEDAKDLVQGFFAALLQDGTLTRFDPQRGKLRTFLCACLDRFVMKQQESAQRIKRGGRLDFVSWDFDAAERELDALASAGDVSAEERFYREWQREIFRLAVLDLEQEYARAGKSRQYRVFEQFDLAEETRPSYTQLAARHLIPETTVTNYLAAARRDLRRLVHQRVRSVSGSDRLCQSEMRSLFGG